MQLELRTVFIVLAILYACLGMVWIEIEQLQAVPARLAMIDPPTARSLCGISTQFRPCSSDRAHKGTDSLNRPGLVCPSPSGRQSKRRADLKNPVRMPLRNEAKQEYCLSRN
jgi:hypothetical protein